MFSASAARIKKGGPSHPANMDASLTRYTMLPTHPRVFVCVLLAVYENGAFDIVPAMVA